MRWLLDDIRDACQQSWNLHQEISVDELMVRYKGKFCPVRQYLPSKPTKWGLKVWCVVDAVSKYVYSFEVYTGASLAVSLRGAARGEAKTGYTVVSNLTEGLHGKHHIVFTDNFFTSPKLLADLAVKDTFGCGTVRSNRIGLPKAITNTKLFAKYPQGTLDWRMHKSRMLAAVTWVDKKPVMLLSSIYRPIPLPGEECSVKRRVHGTEKWFDTSPIHKAYSKWMRGVDVADQMRGTYTTQVRSKKWWHRLFYFLLDTAVVNSYVLYKSMCATLGFKPKTHLNFQLKLVEELCAPWKAKRGCVSKWQMSVPAVHGLTSTKLRRKCQYCGVLPRTGRMCIACGEVFLHEGRCFFRSHYPVWR